MVPLGGTPIACADIRGRVVDVTITTTRGVNLHLAAGYVDERGEEATEERYRRFRVTSDAAQVIASYLVCHPRVAEVRYPGLRGDPTHAVAARVLQGGFGPFVDYRLAGADGADGWLRVEATEADVREQVMALERELAQPPESLVRGA
jgi:O-acetylhomoserine/O-acetylserine sulfhydrylase-like pyridoxal-dependent enzyme